MKPPADALKGRDAFSGASFELRFSTRIASKPCPDDNDSPPRRRRITSAPRGPRESVRAPSPMASVPGAAGARIGRDLIAERELPRHARRNAARHHLLDGWSSPCGAPWRRFVSGTTFSAIVSMPPIPVPRIAPEAPVDSRRSRAAGTSRPASCQASIACETRITMIHVHREQALLRRNVSSAKRVDTFGRAGDVCSRSSLRPCTPGGERPTAPCAALRRRPTRQPRSVRPLRGP